MNGKTLQRIAEEAAAAGRQIDLAGCDYGLHVTSGQHLGVQPYYHFLAGFSRTLAMEKILEIGTCYGGSIMALDRGKRGIEMVTVDKTDIAGDPVKALPHIKRVIGDSLAPDTLRNVKAHLHGPIDLLYIDSKHSYDHTTRNLQVYGNEFSPRFVIFDDIHLNEDMERFWRDAKTKHGEQAFDASSLAGRPCGFGIVQLAADRVSA